MKGSRGFVAETFIVYTNDNEKFFIKVIRKDSFPKGVESNLPVLNELHKLGNTQVPRPIKSANNKLSYVVFLFSFNYKSFFKSVISLTICIFISLLSSSFLWFLLNRLAMLEGFVYSLDSIAISESLVIATVTGVIGTLLWIWP